MDLYMGLYSHNPSVQSCCSSRALATADKCRLFQRTAAKQRDTPLNEVTNLICHRAFDGDRFEI